MKHNILFILLFLLNGCGTDKTTTSPYGNRILQKYAALSNETLCHRYPNQEKNIYINDIICAFRKYLVHTAEIVLPLCRSELDRYEA